MATVQFREVGTSDRRKGAVPGRVWECLVGAAGCVGTIEETDNGPRFYGNALSGHDGVGLSVLDLLDIKLRMSSICLELLARE